MFSSPCDKQYLRHKTFHIDSTKYKLLTDLFQTKMFFKTPVFSSNVHGATVFGQKKQFWRMTFGLKYIATDPLPSPLV
jgi:hypothetical protein